MRLPFNTVFHSFMQVTARRMISASYHEVYCSLEAIAAGLNKHVNDKRPSPCSNWLHSTMSKVRDRVLYRIQNRPLIYHLVSRLRISKILPLFTRQSWQVLRLPFYSQN